MRFRGIHVVNRGMRKGSAAVVAAIRQSGVLKAGHGWYGRGVYGHFEHFPNLYRSEPHIVFEADVEELSVQIIPTTGRQEFFVILRDHDLPVTIIDVRHTDAQR